MGRLTSVMRRAVLGRAGAQAFHWWNFPWRRGGSPGRKKFKHTSQIADDINGG
jgi:hypothetical protein